MQTVIRLSRELADWIALNLDRGCSAADVVSALSAQDVEPSIATSLVDAVVRTRQAGLPLPIGELTLDVAPLMAYTPEPPCLPPGPVIRTFDRDVVVTLRVARPALAVLQSVLSDDECARFIRMAVGRLRPSTVVDPATGRDIVAAHRSSEGFFFRPAETPFIAGIERRLAELMNRPMANGEGLQLLHYLPGAASAPHLDFLAPGTPSNDASIARSGQRAASLVIYLNDVESGGETVFPEIGLAVTPRAGHAVHFEYVDRHGQVDLASVHGAAAVAIGEKWVLTKWVRERPFVPA